MSKDSKTDQDDQLSERIIVPVSPGMSDAIKDFWHENRLNSKSEAVRQLIEAGLVARGKRSRK